MRPIVFMWSPGDSCPRQRATNAAKVSAAPIALGIRGFGNGTDRKRVGVVRNRNNPNVTVQLRKTEDAVRELNLQVQVVEARTSEECERAFTRLARGGCEWRRGARGPNCHRTWTRIAELAQAARLPTAFQRCETSRQAASYRMEQT